MVFKIVQMVPNRVKHHNCILLALPEKCSNKTFFWSVFSCIQTEYGYLLSKSPYSVRIQENTDQKKSVFRHFPRSVALYNPMNKLGRNVE